VINGISAVFSQQQTVFLNRCCVVKAVFCIPAITVLCGNNDCL